MSGFQLLVMILISALVTVALRFLPFLMFRSRDRLPDFIQWLGKQLPRAVMAMLVIYCLKDVQPAAPPHGLPEAIAAACVVLLQVWKRNSLISILAGTAVYMALMQAVF